MDSFRLNTSISLTKSMLELLSIKSSNLLKYLILDISKRVNKIYNTPANSILSGKGILGNIDKNLIFNNNANIRKLENKYEITLNRLYYKIKKGTEITYKINNMLWKSPLIGSGYIAQIIAKVGDIVRNAVYFALAPIYRAIRTLSDDTFAIVMKMINTIKKIVKVVVEIPKVITKNIVDTIKKIYEFIKKTVMDILKSLIEGIKDTLDFIYDFLVSNLIDFFQWIVDNFKIDPKKVGEQFKKIMESLEESSKEWLKK